jgi:glycosyltransferase involved in cell wall biosynthesis
MSGSPSTPTVTWLLAVKNGMPYLPATLASIAAQTYPNQQVLIWDNGSTDGTIDELRRWVPARLPGRLVLDRPLGVGAARAELVRLAETEFCAWIDGDDIAEPQRLEVQMAWLLRHPDIGVLGSQVTRIDEQGAEHGQLEDLPLAPDDILHRLLYTWSLWQPSALFRREAILRAGNYRDMPFEDYDLWLRVACVSNLANLPQRLLKYRVHPKNQTHTIPAARSEASLLQAYVEGAPALFGLSGEEADRLRRKKISFVFPLLLRVARHLARWRGGTVWQRLTSASFLRAARQVTRRRDVATRALLLALAPWARATPGLRRD